MKTTIALIAASILILATVPASAALLSSTPPKPRPWTSVANSDVRNNMTPLTRQKAMNANSYYSRSGAAFGSPAPTNQNK